MNVVRLDVAVDDPEQMGGGGPQATLNPRCQAYATTMRARPAGASSTDFPSG
jgi:hypothetical protein